MDILQTLANMREDDQKKFLTIRTSMRKTYLMAIAATVGIADYKDEDDAFMDSLDIKCQMLATRAGMSTTDKDASHPEENMTDVFSVITRPSFKPDNSTPTKINMAGNMTALEGVDWSSRSKESVKA